MRGRTGDRCVPNELYIRTLVALDDVAQWIEQIDLSTVTPDEIQEMRDRLQRLERGSRQGSGTHCRDPARDAGE
jgi:hypothetical protein